MVLRTGLQRINPLLIIWKFLKDIRKIIWWTIAMCQNNLKISFGWRHVKQFKRKKFARQIKKSANIFLGLLRFILATVMAKVSRKRAKMGKSTKEQLEMLDKSVCKRTTARYFVIIASSRMLHLTFLVFRNWSIGYCSWKLAIISWNHQLRKMWILNWREKNQGKKGKHLIFHGKYVVLELVMFLYSARPLYPPLPHCRHDSQRHWSAVTICFTCVNAP